jgi:hypothetical protein
MPIFMASSSKMIAECAVRDRHYTEAAQRSRIRILFRAASFRDTLAA